MTDREDFRAWFEGPLAEAELALHNGDGGPRRALWSRTEPVSVLGAWRSGNGRREVEEFFTFLAEGFSNCTSYALELLAFDVIGHMAYTAALEHMPLAPLTAPTPPPRSENPHVDDRRFRLGRPPQPGGTLMKTLVVLVAQMMPVLVPAVALVVWLTLPGASKVAQGVQAVIALVVVLVLVHVAGAVHTDPRPFVSDPTLRPYFAHPADNGFPSEHTALASTVAFLVLRYRRGAGLVLLTASVIGGAARVVAHVHHAQDIAAGVLIAALSVAMATVLWRWVRPRLPSRLYGEAAPSDALPPESA